MFHNVNITTYFTITFCIKWRDIVYIMFFVSLKVFWLWNFFFVLIKHFNFKNINNFFSFLSVEEEACKEQKKQCVETGGSCKLETTGVECICPSDTSYEGNLGCQGMQNEKKYMLTILLD